MLNLVEGQTLLLDTRGELQAAELGWSDSASVPMLERIPYASGYDEYVASVLQGYDQGPGTTNPGFQFAVGDIPKA
jgi:hypothetical protein